MEKTCFKCGETKDIEEFYKHSGMTDGHLGKCKVCSKKDTNLRQAELKKDKDWVEKERVRVRKKYHRLNYKGKNKPSKEASSRYNKQARINFPEKYEAHYKAQYLPKTEGCHLHHWSYNEEHWKDVIELKIKDHYKAHRFLIYDQEKMIYRTIENELLDTKERHLEYITFCITNLD